LMRGQRPPGERKHTPGDRCLTTAAIDYRKISGMCNSLAKVTSST
jgi:hypothetical protein